MIVYAFQVLNSVEKKTSRSDIFNIVENIVTLLNGMKKSEERLNITSALPHVILARGILNTRVLFQSTY